MCIRDRPWNDDTQMGAQINDSQLKKILGYIDVAKKEGCTVLCGGEAATEGELAKGAFMKPTLITDVTNDMRIAQEEIFGPVAVVIKFHDEAEVIRMANQSLYGLGGAVWTKAVSYTHLDVYKRQTMIPSLALIISSICCKPA